MNKVKKGLTVIGKTINNRLVELNMTIKELANITGVDSTYISRIMRGYITKSRYITQIEKTLEIKLSGIERTAQNDIKEVI